MASRAERVARIERRDQLALLSKLMGEPSGRKYLYNLLSTCHIYTTSFATNALVMAHQEGERNVGLRLVADLVEASPDMYLQMLKEANRERSSTDTDTRGDPDAESDFGDDDSTSGSA